MTKKGSTKIVNLMTPGARVLMIGCGHISHSEYVLYSTLPIYSTLIAIVLRDYEVKRIQDYSNEVPCPFQGEIIT